LLLLRHAKSSWNNPGLTDHDRPLNSRGRQAAAAMRVVMQQLGLAPDVVLVSTARRTLETLAALEPWERTPTIQSMDGLYLADVPQLLSILREVPDSARSVLLIGHNPGLHDLASTLMGEQAMTPANDMTRRLAKSYPTGALADFTLSGAWHELGEGGGRLVHFLRPRDLPEIAV
jgi:phosphohistidine phosphatase